MITKRVELPATAASARREREGNPQAAQQENTKQGPTVAGYCGVVGTGCGARRPLRGVKFKATITQVLPREDRSSGTRQDALAAQRAEEGALQRRARGPGRQGGCRTKTPSELCGGRS